MEKLRQCMYQGNKYEFHRWFQEGSSSEDGVDLGALLEDENGNIIKVWRVTDIQFIKD